MKFFLVLFYIILDCVLGQNDKNLNKYEDIFGEPNTKKPNVSDSELLELIDIFSFETSTSLPVMKNECRCVHKSTCKRGLINPFDNTLIDIGIQENACGNYQLECCEEKNIIVQSISSRYDSKGCGTRNPNGVGFRITGNSARETEFAEYPWMVAVLKSEKINNEIIVMSKCGASLIHPQVVLTGAHCVSDTNLTLKVRAGEWDTTSTQEFRIHQDRNVKSIIIHPNFNYRNMHNNIALIIVDSPFEITTNVDTVCLPSQHEILENLTCVATGWGKDSFKKNGKYHDILKEVELPIVQENDCEARLRTTRLGEFFILDKSFICAGGELGIDTCTGDGGSPLVCPIRNKKNRYQQRGIVSWGLGCGDPIPGVYANVAYFRSWIDDEMSKLNFDTSTYTV